MQHDIERFLTHLSSELSSSPNTVAAYRNDLTQLLRFLESATALSGDGAGDGPAVSGWPDVTRTRIAGFVVSLRDKGYAQTTVARKIAAVKSYFHFLAAEGLVSADPTETLDSPRVEKALPRTLDASEIAVLLRQPAHNDAPEGLRDRSMLQLLWSTGMRVSELVALNLDDLDLPSGYVRCLGKGSRERIVPVTLEAQRCLEEYLEVGRPPLLRRRDDPALFVNHRGERLTRQGFWLILKGYARRAGLGADVTPQTLRHSFALHQLSQHTDLRSLQELLGHASITTTQIYAQVAGAQQQELARPGVSAPA